MRDCCGGGGGSHGPNSPHRHVPPRPSWRVPGDAGRASPTRRPGSTAYGDSACPFASSSSTTTRASARSRRVLERLRARRDRRGRDRRLAASPPPNVCARMRSSWTSACPIATASCSRRELSALPWGPRVLLTLLGPGRRPPPTTRSATGACGFVRKHDLPGEGADCWQGLTCDGRDPPIRVVLGEDDALLREGVAQLLDARGLRRRRAGRRRRGLPAQGARAPARRRRRRRADAAQARGRRARRRAGAAPSGTRRSACSCSRSTTRSATPSS